MDLSGKLYILSERDVMTREISDYSKMGLVRKTRTVEERIKDHQTGNPREITSEYETWSPRVQELEEMVHHIFAHLRVKGEWFKMSPEYIQNTVVPAICEFVKQQTEDELTRMKVHTLKDVVSNGQVRSSTSDDIEALDLYYDAKDKCDSMKSQMQDIKAKILSHAGTSEVIGVYKVLNLEKHTQKVRFTPEANNTKSRFMTNKRKFYSTFRIVKRPCKNRRTPNTLNLNVPPGALEPDDEIKCMHLEYLQLLGEMREAEYNLDKATNDIKIRIGENDGISGVATWTRGFKDTIELDKDGFFSCYPEHIMCVTENTQRLVIEDKRSYKW